MPAPVSHLARARVDDAGTGIALMLAAWGVFSLVDTSVKWLSLAGIPALQLAFMRFGVHLVLSTGPMLGRDHSGWTAPRSLALAMLARGGLLMCATICNFFALRYLDLAVVAAITFAAPVVVCLLSVPLLGERVGPWRWGAIVLGFLGVLVVVRPWGAAFHPAMLLSCVVPFALGLFSILTRRLAGVAAPRTMQLYAGIVGALCLAPFAAAVWVSPEGPLDWALLFAIGAFAWFGHDLFGRAHGYAPASVLMPFSYSFLLYMALTGWLVFGTVPDAGTLAGAAIIAASGLIIWWRER
ncbi:DMT family transporter [Jannaschia aquimarina]|uniref:EamA-like transporter family protein n=1 Tax=Jannaschia aquimarina TaxID=935700 RepID=A0A0D1EBY4_9RHOB|nr:DMT family transporter [Jannaschia aquimarina]KIT15234.1 EamA-like transporter family protein [Jannaschia aquimarina]SNT32529.1 Permease of the drug/metabolite transporter (DMT) superfamily [Jannaschia aquimarina]